MPDQASSTVDSRLTVARTALHRAADLLETARLDESRLEIDEALELVFLALEQLDSGPPAS